MSSGGAGGSTGPCLSDDADDVAVSNLTQELILTVGHTTNPIDRKKAKVKVFVRTDMHQLPVIKSVTFAMQDGISGSGVEVSTPPYELERVTHCVYPQIAVEVTVRFHELLQESPLRHTHEVFLRSSSRPNPRTPAGRVSRGRGALSESEQTEDVHIYLREGPVRRLRADCADRTTIEDDRPILWAEYEAAPGRFIARSRSENTLGRLHSGAWSGGPDGEREASGLARARKPPSHNDFAAFPVLGGQKTGRFSYASAATAALGKSPATPSPGEPLRPRCPATPPSGGSLGSSPAGSFSGGSTAAAAAAAAAVASVHRARSEGGPPRAAARPASTSAISPLTPSGNPSTSASTPTSHVASVSASERSSERPSERASERPSERASRNSSPPPILSRGSSARDSPVPFAPSTPVATTPIPPRRGDVRAERGASLLSGSAASEPLTQGGGRPSQVTPPTPSASPMPCALGGTGGLELPASFPAEPYGATAATEAAARTHEASSSSSSSSMAAQQQQQQAQQQQRELAAWRHAVATGNCAMVTAWLEHLELETHTDAFRRHSVDGRVLRTLSEVDLSEGLGVCSPLHRRKLLMEIDELRAVAPLRREASAPQKDLRLVGVTDPLELRHLCHHVQASCRDPDRTDSFEVVSVQRVENRFLDHMLEQARESLHQPNAGRSVPPEGGYFHGTRKEAILPICRDGFEPKLWRGGKFGRGQCVEITVYIVSRRGGCMTAGTFSTGTSRPTRRAPRPSGTLAMLRSRSCCCARPSWGRCGRRSCTRRRGTSSTPPA